MLGDHVTYWWEWIISCVETAYSIFLASQSRNREHILPNGELPIDWRQMDAVLGEKIVEASPAKIRDWVHSRIQEGESVSTLLVVYYIYKLFAPGSAAEKTALYAHIKNPNVCVCVLAQHNVSC